ncbi:transcription initiation factor TFIID subunit A-domain-containing protein [Schizophyllum fasciatum]
MDNNAEASTSQAPAVPTPPNPSSTPLNPVDLYQELYEKLKSNPGQQSVQVIQEMATLLKTGKLRPEQIAQFKSLAEMLVKQHKASDGSAQVRPPSPSPRHASHPPLSQASQTAQPAAQAHTIAPLSHPTTPAPQPMLGDTPASSAGYPISASVSATDPGPVQWQTARPTMTGGYVAGRAAGTPAQVRVSGEDSLSLDESRRKRNTPGDQSMRRSIQDLVASVDPNVKIEPEVEDLLLNIADEFIDSVTNFSCRLARHRGGDTLEVKDLQLHLERNHNIRIPGFSDETRVSLPQSSSAGAQGANALKKGMQGGGMSLRAQRLAQVQAAKRENKLM